MLQIYILYKIKLKNKCRFYKTFFSIHSIKNCYVFYFLKEAVTFLLNSIILFFLYKNIDNFGLSETSIYVILFILLFIQQLGYNKTSRNYIQTHLDIYRLSSTTYLGFFRKTILYHCLAELGFKSSSLLPIIFFSCLWSPKSIFVLILGLLAGFAVRANEILHGLTKDIDNKFRMVISCLKTSFGLLLVFIIFTVGFRVASATLFIMKIMLTSSAYDEELLLNDLISSFTDSLEWLMEGLQAYLPFFVVYFAILLITPIVFNIIQYISLWENKMPTVCSATTTQMPKDILNQKGLPFLKTVYRKNINSVLAQLIKQPEILAWLIVDCVILYNVDSEISRFLIIIWLYFVGNSNYIKSLFVVGFDAFGNYTDNVDLYYWRLSTDSFSDIYNQRLRLLKLYTTRITLIQCVSSCVFCLLFISDWRLILLSVVIIISLMKPMQVFNCRLASFSSFFTFANSCRSNLRTSDTDESEMVGDKLQNIFKLPFTFIPMMIIFFDYIYSFLNIYISVILILLLFMFAFLANKQIDQYLEKAGDMLEEINILD